MKFDRTKIIEALRVLGGCGINQSKIYAALPGVNFGWKSTDCQVKSISEQVKQGFKDSWTLYWAPVRWFIAWVRKLLRIP